MIPFLLFVGASVLSFLVESETLGFLGLVISLAALRATCGRAASSTELTISLVAVVLTAAWIAYRLVGLLPALPGQSNPIVIAATLIICLIFGWVCFLGVGLVSRLKAGDSA